MSDSIKITADYPINVKANDKHFFENRLTYKVNKLSVKQYKNVFVSHEGLCLKNLRLLPRSTFNMTLFNGIDRSIYGSYYKLVMEQYLVSKYGKSLINYKLPKNEKYIVIHTKWFNYAFWINSSLLRLIMTKKYWPNAKVIYSESWDQISYVTESLKAFKDVSFERIPKGHHLTIPNLIFPEVRKWTASLNPESCQLVRSYMLQKLPALITKKDRTINNSERIYLTRSKRKVRMLANEIEVQEILKENGFSIVVFEELTFWEQVRIMSEAKVFVSIHGAGFNNINFMPEGGKVLEFINKKYAELEYTFPFWRLSNCLNLKHHIQFCMPEDATNTNVSDGVSSTNKLLVNENLIVDIEQFKINLKLLLE